MQVTENTMTSPLSHLPVRRGVVIVLAVWTTLLAGSLLWNLWITQQTMLRLASIEANASYNKDVVYRRWAAKEGGIYVPASAYTPPNPYLSHLPERDITTPSGRKLTLVNPAYMTRQVYELAAEQYGVRGHITSLKPLRPENSPDPWETKSLHAFETGVKEVSTVATIGDKPYLRFMRPFIVEEPCLKCHAAQGYKLGDIRGGISVSVPLASYYGMRHTQFLALGGWHLLIYLTGCACFLAGAFRLQARAVENEKNQLLLQAKQEELHRYQSQLEIMVAERTAQLEEKTRDLGKSQQALLYLIEDVNETQHELEAANLKLKELDRLKSMFIASMSHELRTPLNSIIGFSSILIDEWLGPLNPEQKMNQATILKNGKHLLALINDVIDISKVEAGMIESISEEFDLDEVIGEAVATISEEANTKGLTLNVAPSRIRLTSDRRRLLQCLINLISNAVKFTDQGSITVEVAQPTDDQVALSIQDTGIGISADDQDRLFAPFMRLNPLNGKYPGTGLGLYLSRKLTTEVLAGDLTVASAPGRGSTFTITIPLRRAS